MYSLIVITCLILSTMTRAKVITFSSVYWIMQCFFHLPTNQPKINWGSGDRISWDQNRRSKLISIMGSNYFVTFHEIKSRNNHLISWLCQFSWDQKLLIMLFRLLISWTIFKSRQLTWDWKSKMQYFLLSISLTIC